MAREGSGCRLIWGGSLLWALLHGCLKGKNTDLLQEAEHEFDFHLQPQTKDFPDPLDNSSTLISWTNNMERAVETIESRRLVRVYSIEAPSRLPPPSPAHFLGQVLHQNVGDVAHINDPWRKFFEPAELPSPGDDPATRIIAVEAANLRAKWLKFRCSTSNEDQLDLDTFEPTIESVFDLVHVANDAIQKKKKSTSAGKITAHFHKFCGTLESHSLLLKVLPEGSEYVSVFTGTLNAVIKVSKPPGKRKDAAQVQASNRCPGQCQP